MHINIIKINNEMQKNEQLQFILANIVKGYNMMNFCFKNANLYHNQK